MKSLPKDLSTVELALLRGEKVFFRRSESPETLIQVVRISPYKAAVTDNGAYIPFSVLADDSAINFFVQD